MRKSNKRVLMIAFCFIMLFMLSTCTYAKKPSKAKARKAYKNYIANSGIARSKAKEVYIDFNRDGVVELFYFYNGSMYPECIVCIYKKGKVYNAGKLMGILSMCYSKKNKRFCVEHRAAFASSHAEYKLSGTKIKQLVYYHPGTLGWTSSGSALKNNKEISAKEYQKAVKKYENWKKINF